jgi:hypothetical protein
MLLGKRIGTLNFLIDDSSSRSEQHPSTHTLASTKVPLGKPHEKHTHSSMTKPHFPYPAA